MNLFDLQAKISLDSSGYEKGLSAAAKQSEKAQEKIENLAESVGAANKDFDRIDDALEKAAKATEGLGKESSDTGKSVDGLTDSISDQKKESNVASDKLDDLSDSEKKAGDEAEKSEKKTNGFSNVLKGLGDAAKTAVKGMTVVFGAATAGITALVKSSVANYSEYEQLVGGVETLFKKSAGTVQKYAANAYKTAGLSANEYMDTVTSFSASLLQSLGGDTEKAAKYADMAITDMSDNANKMGTDMASIQVAYQGFAKQNYTMLDNLKLGRQKNMPIAA